ncbi:uncharacterized protein K02A2.6-like [Ylistrum balloti]|uniref:uncharacterized protein K02A2.6-like n=1 Tax=Ylistrum balloti TaxID=509963 RepID=UPI002905A6FE|nr:uncharacterized protein K02A2.6-like [Ylistrum balloti]
MEHIRPPPELDFSASEGNLPEKWRKWEQSMRLYLDIAMSDKSEKEKCSAFLYIIGQDGREIYNTFTFTEEEKDKIEVLINKFKSYCAPRENITVWRHRFYTRTQGKTETIDEYVTELRIIAKNCKFGTLEDEMLRDRIVCGVFSEKVKERLLRDNQLTLERAVTACRASEESQQMLKNLNTEEVNAVHKNHRDKQNRPPKERYTNRPTHSARGGNKKQSVRGDNSNHSKQHVKQKLFQCGRCGTKHGYRKCPAFGQICDKCKGMNHFARQCKTKVVHANEAVDMEGFEDLFIGAVHNHKTEVGTNEAFANLNINGTNVRFKLDTGSQANIISDKLFNCLNVEPKIKLSDTATRLSSYTGNKIPIKGKCRLQCLNENVEFYVAREDTVPLLGFKSCQDLGLVKVVMMTEKVTEPSVDKQDPTSKFLEIFKGLGCLKEPYTIKVDKSVTPVVNPPRKIPANLRDKLKITLNEMEKNGVVRKVDEPTDWVSSIVLVEKPKSGKLRVCLDPRNLNKAIKREHFELPTIEDITTRMSGAKIFTKLDANSGYWQIPLDEPSQLLTTFNTPFGRYCYLRMPFGIKSAQEVFQKRIAQHFDDIEGVEVDIDDILVFGKDNAEHDARLDRVLRRCEQINLTLNKDKCRFSENEVTYIGHRLSATGVKPDPEKLSAITEMPRPVDKKGVERLLGTVNYLAKFIPNMSTITQPIRELLRKDVAFQWNKSQDDAFKQILGILSKEPVLAFYDPRLPTTVSADASKYGLGAVILQRNKPIAFASRAMTDTESRYAQIEKELLAVTFALERFNNYTCGSQALTVESDHKPLEAILKKPLSQAPPRLQRMLLRLQRYDFTLIYRPGKELVVADTLSRAYLPNKDGNMDEELNCHVHTVLNSLPVSVNKMDQIRTRTDEDEQLSQVKALIENGWPENKNVLTKNLQEFWKLRNELTINEGIVLKGERIVIPESLQDEILSDLHVGHFGIEKTKLRARSIVYWHGMNTDIADMISRCSTCMDMRNNNQKEPLKPTPVPSGPWQVVGTDLFSWNQSDFLIVTDYYSRYFEVAKLENTKSVTVITHLKSIFAQHGIPFEVRSDNGPQYSSSEFKTFATKWKFKHTTSSPYFAQANGLAEKSVQTMKRILEKTNANGQDPYLALLEYRNSPTDTESPAQLLMSRELRSVLPVTQLKLQPRVVSSEHVQKTRQKSQQKQKKYFDIGAKRLSELNDGDIRFVLNTEDNGLQETFIITLNTRGPTQ